MNVFRPSPCFKLFLLFVLVFLRTLSFAQELLAILPSGQSRDHPVVAAVLAQSPPPVTITGKVTANTGEALPGVTIAIKGTTIGTTTGLDGSFSLTVPDEHQQGSLVISFVGYQTQQVPIAGRRVFNVVLSPDVKALQEVVVIGYQAVRKQDLTGAVDVVNANVAKRVTATTVAESMQGLASGVNVRSSGRPGQEAIVEIRGVSNFGNNQPLYVIDGLITEGSRDFNPNDVESIQILKDASAAAIYGSRAANGVIIITTKKGKEGPLRVDGSVKTGIQRFHTRWDLMNATEWAATNNEIRVNSGLQPINYDTSISTDWQEELMQDGYTQDYNLTFSGGGSSSNYLISANYFNNKGAIIGTAFDRANLRINTNGSRGRFTFGQNFMFAYTHEDQMHGNPFIEMVRMLPIIPVKDPSFINSDNPEGWGFGREPNAVSYGENVVALNRLNQADFYRTNLRGVFFGEFKIFDWLSYKMNIGADVGFDHFKRFTRRGMVRLNTPTFPGTINAEADENRAELRNLLFEHTLNFNRILGPHSINGVVGVSEQTSRYDIIYAIRRDFTRNPQTGEFYTVLNAGQQAFQSGGSINRFAILGYLGRLNYNYADRYLASFTFRYDGDSRFGAANRWGFFPSASAAWRISKEDFFRVNAINDLKLRASYGALGNTGHGPWSYIPSVTTNPRAVLGVDQQPVPGATQVVIVDPDLKWEEKRVTNVGLETGLLNNRVTFTAEWYRSVSKDVLVPVPVSPSTGGFNPAAVDDFTTMLTNAASIKNTGFDFSGTYRTSGVPFSWDLTLNLTTINNEVLNLGNQGAQNYRSTHLTRTQIGHPIAEFFLLRTDGIFQNQNEIDAHRVQPDAKPGDIRYRNVNGDNVINNNDREFAGSPWPDLTTGLVWNASYRNFSLGMQWYGVFGNKIFNAARWWMERFDDNANYTSDIKPWRGPGTSNDMPRLASVPLNANEISDRWLEDGSYLRLRSLELGYSIPAGATSRIGFTSARIFLNGQNLLTFTGYSGLDPDVANPNILLRGWDAGIFPQLRMFSAGVNFGF